MADASQPSAEEKARYDALRQQLIQAIPFKRANDKKLAQIEAQIHDLESTYLAETSNATGGNIINGFDGYLKNPGAAGRRKHELSEHDRLFSLSSTSSQRSLDLLAEDGGFDEKDSTPSATITLPPSGSISRSASQRKKRPGRGRSTTGDLSGDDEPSPSVSRKPSKRARLEEE